MYLNLFMPLHILEYRTVLLPQVAATQVGNSTPRNSIVGSTGRPAFRSGKLDARAADFRQQNRYETSNHISHDAAMGAKHVRFT